MSNDIVEIDARSKEKPQLAYRTDGSVSLPETELLPAKSEAALQATVQGLPDDVEPVVKTILKTRRSSYSYLQLLFLGVFMVLALLLTFWLLPHPVNVEGIIMVVKGPPLPSVAGRELKKVAEEAIVLYNERKYMECTRKLYNSANALKEPLLANLYCEALYNVFFDAQDHRQKREYEDRAFQALDQMEQQEPDNVRWPLHRVKIKSRNYLRKNDFHLTAEDAVRQAGIVNLLKKFDKLHKLDEDNGSRNSHIIDLLEARLLTAAWLLKGFPKYPDDLQDAGVMEREKAYGIAKSHPDTRDFLELRKGIVKKILEGDNKLNYYYFNGDERFSRKYLHDELNEIDTLLNGKNHNE